MYIGATDDVGLFTLLREVLDNTVDEALAGHCTECHIHADPSNNEYWVYDNGRGMPVGNIKISEVTSNKTVMMPALQAIVSLHHAGGKLNAEGSSAYLASRGSHGIGIKCSNFLSDLFEVFTFNKGKWWTIQFKKGIMTRPLTQVKAPKHPVSGKLLELGTLVHFIPDQTIFSAKTFSLKYVDSWATLAAYFTPKFRVHFSNAKGNKKEYYAPGGPKQFVQDRVDKLGCTALSPDTFIYQTALIDCVLKFTDYDGCELQAFTNGLFNCEGGKHQQAVFAAVLQAIQPYIKKKQEFSIQELKEGLVGLVNAKLSAPKFDSQTKEKLVDDRCGVDLKNELAEAFKKFFASNKALAGKICDRCAELKGLRNKFIASKTVLKELKAISRKGLPVKAATSPNCKPEQRELYLLEGESAAGGCRDARDPKYQEILPLKGKILNCVVAGTMVLLVDGTTRPIESLDAEWLGVGFDTEVHAKTADVISPVFHSGLASETLTLTFEDGHTLECTPEHQLLTQRGYVAAKDLLDSDDVVTIHDAERP
jgi:DNA gyrase subunit B